ncbi:hypothetical protein [uncultured Sphingomonas sp.]|uniref:hypothetical protein n=1 Tax=uncultured Sphingomonas sp. TaxID=158754 RepID=UPI0035CBBAF0
MSEETRRRRRWLNLAEFVAIAGLLIAALGAWSSWSERRDAATEKRAAAVGEAKGRARFELRAEVVRNGREVRLSDPRHEIQDVTIAFPGTLGITDRRPAMTRIELDWFDRALLKATDGAADEREGRLPVLVTARYLDSDAVLTASAILDIIWRTEGRVLGGRTITIEAARLRKRGGSRTEIDALWARELAASAR